ncbi:hypothetical protein CHF27_004960 [Romboutsia maritimum]|uniref:YprB ribonuclease H-like domain-containing protein n=1 Tax=Romboutsia maritimum TaxID=2020948 RepID=A0A371IUM5_9FIRM|nr:ribonuclease H-like domain-containing protein [Romboutsia maritimum]RDY24169.1 hypothetical protein CHF27_004960 [Romboutsia maritimum]
MEVITKVLDEFIIIPPNHFVFDIETTGLSPKYCKVILIGVLFNKDNKTIIKQFFAQSEDDEKELLLEFVDAINKFKNHVTFNGITFDIPFLNFRFKKHSINFSLDKLNDIDILRLIKPYKEKLSLSDCKLKTIEKYIGINRNDTISGKESVQMYKDFVNNNSKELKYKILLHNYEDVYYLAHLFKIKNILEDKLDLLHIKTNTLDLKIIPIYYKITSSKLTLKYKVFSGEITSINIYNEKYTITSEKDYIYLDLSINKGVDEKNNTILFYKISKLIPLKYNDLVLEDNIHSLCNFLIQKELKKTI